MADYTVQDLQDNLNYLNETKNQIKQAIIDKGQPITDEDTFRSYVNKIENIETGIDTSDATATADDIISPKTAYVNGEKIRGRINVSYKENTEGLTYDLISNLDLKGHCCFDISYEFNYILLGDLTGNILYMYEFNNNVVGNLIDTLDLTEHGINLGLRSASITKQFDSNNNIYIYIVCKNSGNADTRYIATEFNRDINKFDNSNLCTYTASINANRPTIHVVANPKYMNFFATSASFHDGPSITLFNYIPASKTFNKINTWYVYNGGGQLNSIIEWSPDGIYACIRSLSEASYGSFYKFSNNFSTGSKIRQGTQIVMLENGYVLDTKNIYNSSNKLMATFSELPNYNKKIFYYYYDGFLYVLNYSSGKAIAYKLDLVNFTLTKQLEVSISTSMPDITYAGTAHYPKSNRFRFLLYGPYNSKTAIDFKPLSSSIILDNVELNGFYTYNTSDTNATSSDLLVGKTAYTSVGKITGTMPNNGELNYTPSDSAQTIPIGYTSGGTISAVDITTLNEYQDCLNLSNNILNGGAI